MSKALAAAGLATYLINASLALMVKRLKGPSIRLLYNRKLPNTAGDNLG